MAVTIRDIKILWSRAAGRCSMPDCRAKLIKDSSTAEHSQEVLIGETCHIVARKPNGPRGNSILSEDDRDRYPNLILLCRNHHITIDQDPQSWPIEILHGVKVDHELWVEENLSLTEQSKSRELYIELVELATKNLCLASWDHISDGAVRGFLSDKFVQGSGDFGTTVFRCVWPDEKPGLESAIRNLGDRVSAFVNHFLSFACLLDGGQVWAEDKTWKRTGLAHIRYGVHADRSMRWQEQSFNYLINVVVALNEFADSVRIHLIRDYFIMQGRFTLFDSIGVTNESKSVHYLPCEYIEVDTS